MELLFERNNEKSQTRKKSKDMPDCPSVCLLAGSVEGLLNGSETEQQQARTQSLLLYFIESPATPATIKARPTSPSIHISVDSL
jgi:hypothetical protein